MFKSLFDSPGSLFFAILIHALLVAVAIVGFDWDVDKEKPKYKVVQARVVDESKIVKKIADLKKNEQKKLRQEKVKEEEQRQEEKRQAENIKKQQQADERKIELEKKRIRDEHKREKFKNQQIEKQKIENKLKAEQEKQKKIKKEKQRLEKVKQQERDKEKREEQKRKDEKDLMLQQMAEEEAALKQEFELEQSELDNARDSVDMSRVEKIVAMIRQRVEKNWRRSTSLKQKLRCVVYVKLMPTGDVLHVEITKSSGDDVFDKSVENAVRKAAPFPFPLDIGDIFDKIREVEFEFDPDI